MIPQFGENPSHRRFTHLIGNQMGNLFSASQLLLKQTEVESFHTTHTIVEKNFKALANSKYQLNHEIGQT